MRTLEICAGSGGQALGLHWAGAEHAALVELNAFACDTLRSNNERLQLGWGPVLQADLGEFAKRQAYNFHGEIDLLAGGVPCPPFSKGGQQLGDKDERDLFPTAIEIARIISPKVVLLENVPGLMEEQFAGYRQTILNRLANMGLYGEWRLLRASEFGVPQLRPRAVMVALNRQLCNHFNWPEPLDRPAPTVGQALHKSMASRGWPGAGQWADKANTIAPTLVGGSHKHGGPDLGPSRAKKQWQRLGVNAHRVGSEDEIPNADFAGVVMRDGRIREGFENMPLLTVSMAAKLQGFPGHWEFSGSKTHAYRQVGNAFPPPVAQALGCKVWQAWRAAQLEEEQILGEDRHLEPDEPRQAILA